MPETLAWWFVRATGVYLAIGTLFALPFVLRWVGRLDPVAGRGTWGFRVLVFPGAVALWPWLLRLLVGTGPRPPVERNAHRDAAAGTAR